MFAVIDDPDAACLGKRVVSLHDTEDAAYVAIGVALHNLRAVPGNQRSYLQWRVLEVEAGVEMDDYVYLTGRKR